MTLPVSHRLAYKIHLPIEMQQLGSQMLDSEGFCACGRLITRWEGKFLLAAVMPSVAETTLAAWCQPCAQVINATLKRLHKTSFMDKTESVPSAQVPKIVRPIG